MPLLPGVPITVTTWQIRTHNQTERSTSSKVFAKWDILVTGGKLIQRTSLNSERRYFMVKNWQAKKSWSTTWSKWGRTRIKRQNVINLKELKQNSSWTQWASMINKKEEELKKGASKLMMISWRAIGKYLKGRIKWKACRLNSKRETNIITSHS